MSATWIDGTSGDDDPLNGTAIADCIDGHDGNDAIYGLTGDDLLRGGAGNDTLDGGLDFDTADYTDATSAVTVDLSAGTATGGAGTDTLISMEGVIGSDFGDTFNFTSASNMDVYTVDGGAGTDTLDLSSYNIADAVFSDGKVMIDDGNGFAFEVNYSNIENVQFSDSTATVLTGNTSGTSFTGTATYIEGDASFTIDFSGAGSVNWNYTAATNTLTVTDVTSTDGTSDLTITNHDGSNLVIDSITVDTRMGSVTTNVDIDTLTVTGGLNRWIDTITVSDGAGTITTLNVAKLDNGFDPIVDANVGSFIGVDIDQGSSYTITGDVDYINVNEYDGGSLIVEHAYGVFDSDSAISGDYNNTFATPTKVTLPGGSTTAASNVAPYAADWTLTTDQNTTYTLAAGDFGYGDLDGEALAQVQITSLEHAGSLKLSGADVTLNQVITKAQIDAGNLTFAPGADQSGTSYDRFQFKVNDGNEYSLVEYTTTVDVDLNTTISWMAGQNTLLVSDDGINWTDVGLPSAMGGNSISDIHYGEGLWIMVGQGGKMARSVDGVTWTATDVSSIFGSVKLQSIHYSHDRGLWMVVANDFTVATSSDGITWTQQGDLNGSGTANTIGLVEGDGVWFATFYKSGSGSSTLTHSLDDGATWSPVSSITGSDSEGAMYGNGIGLSFSYDGQTQNSLRSTDNWSSYTTFTLPSGGGGVREGTYGNGMFVIGAEGGGTYTSSDGVSWTWHNGPTDMYDIQFLNGTFVAQGWGSEFFTSTNGTSWTSRVDAASGAAQEPAFGGAHNEPAALDFTDQTGVGTSTVVTSNEFVVTDIDGPLYVFAGATADVEVRVNGGAWKPGSSTTLSNLAQVNSGDTVEVRMTSDASSSTEKIVTVQIGTSITHWSVTTGAANTAPTAADNTITINEDIAYTFAEADFGFSDVDGGDVLTKVKITSLESAGTLKLSGTDVTLNQEILVADIPNLAFTPAQDANGATYDSFDFKVHDGTEYSVADNTITVDVTAVNDAPTASDNTVTVVEDTSYTFSAGDFGFSDVDTGDTLTKIQITVTQTSGTLKLSGADVTDNQEILVADIPNLVFTPVPNATGAGYDSFDFKVHDGTEYSVVDNTITVDVTGVQDAPTASDTTVVTDPDTNYTFSTSDFDFTDLDGDSLAKIQVTSLESVGALKLSGVDVTANQVILAADLPNLVFIPNPGEDGVPYDSFNFKVHDGTEYSATDYTLTIDVNTAPVAEAGSDQYVTEGDSVMLDATGSTDPSGEALDNTQTSGSEQAANTTTTGDQKEPAIAMASDGSYVVVWQGVDSDQAGVFAQRYDASGNAVGSEFQVNTSETGDQKKPSVAMADDGSFVITWEGVDSDKKGVFAQRYDSSGNTVGSEFQVNTSETDDQKEPSIAIASDGSFVVVWEGVDADLAGIFGQRYDASGNTVGSEFLVNSTTTNDQKSPSIAMATDDGFLVTWEGVDSDKKGIFAQRYDASGNTVGSEFQVNTSETDDQKNATAAFADDGSFVVSWEGIDSGSGKGASKGIFIQRYDSSGTALGSETVVNTTITGDQKEPGIAMMDDGRFVVTWEGTDADKGGVYAQKFEADGTAIGSEFRVNTDTTGDQKKPVIVLNDDGDFTIAYESVDADGKGIDFQKFTSKTDLTYTWTQIGGDAVTLSDANSPYPRFTTTTGMTDPDLVFQLSVSDGSIVDTDTVTVHVNVAPTASDSTVTATEDIAYTFSASDFSFADANSGDTLAQVQITSLESAGDLKLNGVDVTANQVITKADIDAGKLTFLGASDAFGTSYDSFDFKVHDGGLYSASSYTMTVDVDPVSDFAPTSADNTVTTDEDVAYTFTVSDFNYSDGDPDPFTQVKVTSLESAGSLKLNGTDVTLNQVVSVADITAGKLTFVSAQDGNGVAYDSFQFKVHDSLEYSSSAYTMTVDVNPVQDAPTAADNTVTTNEDTAYTFAAGDFGFSDPDSGDSLTKIQITSLESAGTLKLSGTDVTANQEILVADIPNLVFTPAQDANGASYDSFDFKVHDGTEYSAADNTITVDVTAVNDAPTAADNTVTTNEDTGYTFAAGDFGFSDVDTGDTLTKIQITALESAGTLKLSGTDVTANQEILLADIPNLVFTPAQDANGASYDSFDFKVHDGTEYSASSNTITVDVTAVQDAPTASDNTVTTNEDTAYTFSAGDFGFSDVDAGDTLTKIQITALESAGTLKLSGTDVTANQEILLADIPNLIFTPAQDANGASYDSFDFKVHDGTEYSASSNTITVDVTAVNDAPTAADNTVTTNEDTAYTFAAGDFGFSDVDTGDTLTKIQITSLESAGTLKLSGTDVTANQEILLADIPNLTFTPAQDQNGASYDSFDFKVHDGTEFSASSNTITVDVTAVQDAPTAADNTVTTNEDTAYTFAAGDFGFSDVDAGDTLTKIQVTSLESAGTLKLSGTDVTSNQEILLADIPNLVFTPAQDANGASYDSFDFKVHDGTEYSASSNTITVDVTAVQDAPTASDNTVTTNEDTSYTFSAGDFGFSDVDAGDTLTKIQITALESAGTLKLSGTDVTANQEILVADIPNLVFTPAQDANGASYDSFDFKVHDGTEYSASSNTVTVDVTAVQDAPTAADNTVTTNEDTAYTFAAGDFGFSDVDAGDTLTKIQITALESAGTLKLSGTDVTANQEILVADVPNLIFTPAQDANGASYDSFDFKVHDGTEYSAASNTITVDVTAVQDAPTAADNTVTTNEDTAYTFAAGDFGFSDVDSGDTLTKIQITALESAGTLKLSGTDVTTNQEILVADIPNLIFTPAQDANGASYDSFNFKVHDGTEFSASSNTITVDVTAVQDAPTAADNTVTTNEDTGYTFSAGDFGFSDVDTGDTLTKIQITALESAGTLKLSGTDVTANQEILVADIPNLIFTPAQDANGASYDSFDFKVHDGTEYSASSNTITIDVTAVQDAPTAADNTVTTNEDTSYTFSAGDFGFSDVDTGDTLTKIQITGLESAGTLKLSGTDVTANQEILLADIPNLVFTPAQDANGASYDSFDFKVHDGIEYSVADNTITVDVTPVQDAPTAADNTVTTSENNAYTFSTADFGFSDVDSGDTLTKIQITGLESAGALKLSGTDVTLNQEILVADIPNLLFTPALDENGVGYDSFDFKVHDGTEYSAADNTVTVDVTPIQSAPSGADSTVTINEDTAYTFAAGDFGFSDPDVGDTLTKIQITGLESAGSLKLSGVDVTANQDILVADIPNLVFTPAQDANGASYDSFDFKVHDGIEYSAADNTITVDVTAVQDAPTASDNTVTTNEDTAYTFAAGDFGFSDVDAGDTLAKIQITGLESAGTLKLSGTDVTVNQEILVADIPNLVFTPAQDQNGTSYDSFDFKVHDGTEYSAADNTITVDVTAVQDAPTAADNTVTTNEDTPYTFSAGDFGFSDVDAGDTLTKIQITGLESAGTLKLSGTDVTANQEILVADIPNLVFTPAQDQNGTSYDSFDFKVHDGTEYSAADNTITVDVTAVQDAPTAADNTVTTNEDTAYTFSAGDFGFSDVDAGDTLTKIQITALESAGTLKLSGTDVTANQEILVADIPNLVFTPAQDQNGASYDSFDFKVHDGTEYSVADNTITVDVTAVQDAPTAADNTVTTNEDTAYTFSAGDFGFSDVDTGDTLTKIQITSLESAGALKLSGADVTANQEILLADIPNLIFTPAQDQNGAGYDSFDFKVHDGTEYSAADNTITVDVTAVQDAPTAADNAVTTNEDTAYTFSAGDFGFSDVDTGDTLTKIQITGLESAGTLKLSGTDVTANQEILVADIPNLVFMPAQDQNGASYDSFDFKVHDGIEYSAVDNTITVDVTAVQDAPTAADNTVTTNEDTAYTFSAGDFGFSDVDAGDTLTKIQVTGLESAGTLKLSGTDVTANQEILVADIPNLVFTPAQDANGVSYDSFDFKVHDGTEYSAADNTITVDVTAVQDAPTAADNTVTTNEDTGYTFSAGDFGFSDVDTGDTLTKVQVTGLESAGTLKLSGVDVTTNQEILVADIPNLVFTPAQDANGTSYDSFDFKVHDGIQYSAADNTITVDVTAVQDAPTAADNTVTTNEDTSYTFGAGDFGFSDVDAGDTLTKIQITGLESAGNLKLSGIDVTLNQEILVADIPNLVFAPAQDANGAGYDSFDFKVHDGTEYSAADNTITVDVTAVQDAPTAADNTVTTNEDTAYTFTGLDFGFSDVDAGDTLTKIQITGLESAGTLKLSGVDVTTNQEILVADIPNLVFTPAQDANGAGYDSFDFKVHDGTEYSAADNTITVDVTAVQDAPTASDNTVTTNEDTGYTFSAGDFGFSDVDTGDTLTKIQVTGLESAGTLKLSGTDVTLNQEILVADIPNLVFMPAQDQNGAAYDSFDFKVHDGVEYSAADNTITVDVTAVQDAPTAADNTVTINEDTAYTFGALDFGFSDVDTGDTLTKIQITGLESAGTLKLSGVDVTTNQEILVADIPNLVFTPAADGNGAAYDSFDFKVHDGSEYSVADHTITVDVTPVQDAPTASNSNVTTNEDTAYTFSAADFNFVDPDGESLTQIQVTSLESAGSLRLNGVDVTLNQVISVADINSGLVTFAPVADANGLGYDSFDFKVHDGTEFSALAYQMLVDVNAINDAPTVDAGPSQAVDEGDVVNLAAVASDIDGPSLGYTWTQLSGPSVTLSDTAIANPTFMTPQGLGDYTVVFQVEASDGSLSSTDTVTITVTGADLPPVVSVADIGAVEGDEVMLVANATDPEGQNLTYQWTQISGAPVTLVDANTATARFGAPLDLGGAEFEFQVEVSDGSNTVVETMKVTLVAAEPEPQPEPQPEPVPEPVPQPAPDPEPQPTDGSDTSQTQSGGEVIKPIVPIQEAPTEETGNSPAPEPSTPAESLAGPESPANDPQTTPSSTSSNQANSRLNSNQTEELSAEEYARFIESQETVERPTTGTVGERVLPDTASGDEVALSASVMDLPDREGAPVLWRQIAGTKVELSDDKAVSPSFTAPKLLVSEELVFEFQTVRDGKVVTETVSVVVDPVVTVKRPQGYALAQWDDDGDDDGHVPDATEPARGGLLTWLIGTLFSSLRIGGSEKRSR